jgi:drug/metabolite transporter, DME family
MQPDRVSHAASRLRILAAATLFSTGGAAFKLCAFTGWQVAGLRGAVAAIAVLLVMPQARRAWTWRAALVGGAYAVTTVLFVQANKLTTAANAVFLEDASPLCILLLGPWLLREPVQRRDLWVLGVAALGMTLFFIGVEPPRATATNPLLGNILAAASSVTFALVVIGYRWITQRPGGSAASVAAAAVSGNVLAFLVSLPWIFPVVGGRAVDWLIVLYLGTVQLGLGYVLLAQAMPHVPALQASLLLLLEPVLNPIWAWWIHGEAPSAWSLAGGTLILGATVWRIVAEGRERRAGVAV